MTTLARPSRIRRPAGAPTKAVAVARERGAAARSTTLASRFRGFARGLGQAGRRADVLRAVLDVVSTTRVPDRMAASLVDLAFDWFGGEAWAVIAVSEARGLQWLADRGVTKARRAAMAEWAGRAVGTATTTWSPAARD